MKTLNDSLHVIDYYNDSVREFSHVMPELSNFFLDARRTAILDFMRRIMSPIAFSMSVSHSSVPFVAVPCFLQRVTSIAHENPPKAVLG